MVLSQIKQMSNFHPLEIVGRGIGTQIQVSEKWIILFLSG